MWPSIDDAQSAIQFVTLLLAIPMGLSHILYPAMWIDFFVRLNELGTSGLILKVLAVELWPAILIVTLHQVWWGPGVVVTLYGWGLLAKVCAALLVPGAAMTMLGMAESRGRRGFTAAGAMLIVVGMSAGAALIWG